MLHFVMVILVVVVVIADGLALNSNQGMFNPHDDVGKCRTRPQPQTQTRTNFTKKIDEVCENTNNIIHDT